MDGRYLFKAKRIDNGEWVQGSCVYTFAPSKGYVVGIMVESYFIVEENGNMVSIDKNTICQCTGLKDKNGNLIWENDIVKFKRSDDKEFVGEISYVEHYGAFFVIHSGCSDNQLYAFGDYEVIGNIFDNPELLERGCKNDCK